MRASMLLEPGDVGGARIVPERVVQIGSAQATFSLAETYDPRPCGIGKLRVARRRNQRRISIAKAAAEGIRKAKERYEARRRQAKPKEVIPRRRCTQLW